MTQLQGKTEEETKQLPSAYLSHWWVRVPCVSLNPPLWAKISSFSRSFRKNIGQIVGWHPHGSWYPLWEILNPPLQRGAVVEISIHHLSF